MGGPQPEQRQAARVPLHVEASYEDRERQVFLATRDLSEAGIYLVAEDPPETGVPARVMLELPGHRVLLRIDGVVARRDPKQGFALSFDRDMMGERTRESVREFARSQVTACSQ